MAASPVVPGYGSDCLNAVLPGAAASLGLAMDLPAVSLPGSDRICVVLVDGLGDRLLSPEVAPFLSSFGSRQTLRAGCPTTTATSLGSFGAGRPPGQHGLVGYQVLDPDRGVLLNELKWHPEVDPVKWQPYPSIFEQLQAASVRVTTIGSKEFAGSGFNAAALRGGDFVGAKALSNRVDIAVRALLEPGLAYLYWADVDTSGHLYGVGSKEWNSAVALVDAQLARLAGLLPSGTLLVVTADHGMVDAAAVDRLDLALRPDLMAGVALLGGEARLGQLYCEPASAEEIALRFAEELGDRAWVVTRSAAIAGGWFGPVDDRVVGRVGNVLVAGRGKFTLVDSSTADPVLLKLVGQHGSLTEDEQLVPLIIGVCGV